MGWVLAADMSIYTCFFWPSLLHILWKFSFALPLSSNKNMIQSSNGGAGFLIIESHHCNWTKVWLNGVGLGGCWFSSSVSQQCHRFTKCHDVRGKLPCRYINRNVDLAAKMPAQRGVEPAREKCNKHMFEWLNSKVQQSGWPRKCQGLSSVGRFFLDQKSLLIPRSGAWCSQHGGPRSVA